jgi:nitrogen fixation protein NifU and related proteins
VTAYRTVVLEHFRRPRNRGPLSNATLSSDGANALCGDRIRVELRLHGDLIAEARFTADACALCIASASLLTERVTGLHVAEARAIDAGWINQALEGEPPPGSVKCALLPLDTLRRALSQFDAAAS